jgi:hypothetical protein
VVTMLELNYTEQSRRPSVKQIIAAWKNAGRPREFEVINGETYAHFETSFSCWSADGNGCRGVDRDGVLKELNRIES